MKSYFEYSLILEKNGGILPSELVEEGGELSENAYAKAVLEKGEKGAQEGLRRSVATIAENDEKIDSLV
jgi:hypothetical protein